MHPLVVRVKQNVPSKAIDSISEAIKNSLSRISFYGTDLSGKKIGITAGSRGINGYPEILKQISQTIKDAGGYPVLIPAMGSHGGATADGQREVLAKLGITERTVGAPIQFCMDTVLIGETRSGIPVYCNKMATQIDGLVVVNRIKTHTDFSGEIESGICKMLAIGLGSDKGAITTHSHALLKGYEKVIVEVAETMIKKIPILFAIGIVENWKGCTSELVSILPGEIICKEKILLKGYKDSVVKLPFDEIDILIVGEIGKNIAGTGMDTKVIGRIYVKGQKEPNLPKIGRIVVLDLTPESFGNAIGIGLADITTQGVFQKINLQDTSLNCITSMAPEQGFLPCVVENDEEAVAAAFKTLGALEPKDVRLVCIKNTSNLEQMLISKALINEARLNGHLEILGDPEKLQFDSSGKLINLIGW